MKIQTLKKMFNNTDYFENESTHIFFVKNWREGAQSHDYVLDQTGGIFTGITFPEDNKQVFFLFGSLDGGNDLMHPAFAPYIVSLEFVSKESMKKINTSVGIKTISDNTEKKISLDEMETELGRSPDFLRKEVIIGKKGKPKETVAYAVFIRISETTDNIPGKTATVDGKTYDCTNLLNYFICSDSRTYKESIDVTSYVQDITAKSEPLPETIQHNLLIYGAPGTGKSYYIDKMFKEVFYEKFFFDDIRIDNEGDPTKKKEHENKTEENEKKKKELLKGLKDGEFKNIYDPSSDSPEIPSDEKLILTAQKRVKDNYFTRVTFYEDYSYESFVGCYKPVKDADGRITYDYEAGPFTNIYIEAMKHPKINYLLAIEEINRAKAAAVFGDLFQVLDRDSEGNSEYSVKPEAALDKYLKENLDNYDGTVKLPKNLYIWATMNSADQDVYVLDSAFKRRWQFKYMDINTGHENDNRIIHLITEEDGKNTEGDYTWDSFRTAINNLLKNKGYEEDRWIGSYFFKDNELKAINEYMKEKTAEKRAVMINPLADKLLVYLLQDVVKLSPEDLFKDKKYYNTSEIRSAFPDTAINKIIKIDIKNLKQYTNNQEENEISSKDANKPGAENTDGQQTGTGDTNNQESDKPEQGEV